MDHSTKGSSDRVRLAETVKLARRDGDSRTGQIGSSATLVRLASRLEIQPHELALRLSEEVVRRTKYHCVEVVNDDGTVTYTAPLQVIEGAKSR